MKKIVSIAIVVALVLSLTTIAAFSGSSASSKTVIYRADFEESGAGTFLMKAGVTVGEIVEFPSGSGNHCLRYTINAETRSGSGGTHPYIWPAGIGGILAAQGDLDDGEDLWLSIDMATDGPTAGSYMYPFMLLNGESEVYFQSECGIYYPGENSFKTAEWSITDYTEKGAPGMGADLGYPLPGQESGGIAFCDENTLDEETYIYVDNIELAWHGSWKPVTDAIPAYRDNGNSIYTEISGGGSNPTNPTKPTNPTNPTKPSNPTNPPAAGAGDANGDGNVDMKDVLIIRKKMAGVAVTGFNEKNADFNGDGNVDMKDVLGIRKKMAGI